jgi:hypothetical protein
MIGVQARHEPAHIVERPAKREGLDECQNVALSGGHGIRVPPYDLCIEPGDPSVVGPQPWLTRLHKSAAAGLINNSTAASVEWHPRAQSRSSAAIPPALAADVVRLIVVDLLGSDDGSESPAPWPRGRHDEHRLLPRAAPVRWV